MPIIDPSETVGEGFGAQLPEPVAAPAPRWTDLWTAAMQDNTAESISRYAGTAFEKSLNEPIPGYDPFQNIHGYEDYAANFIEAQSPGDVAIIKRRIDEERKAHETLAAGGAAGMSVALASGILDPVNLLPASIAVKGLKGGKVLTTAVETALAGAAAAGVSEAILQPTQETRTASESALNIAASTLLSGVMGSALGRMANIPGSKSVGELERAVTNELGLPGATGGSVGAKAARETTLEQEGVKSALGTEKLTQGNYVVGTPLSRTLASPSVEVRRIAGDLAETKTIQNKNTEGIPSLPSVEQRVRAWHGPLAEALGEVDRNFVKYRTGKDVPNVVDEGNASAFMRMARLGAGNVRDLFGTGGRLSYSQFRDEVGRAMRNGDMHDIPEVAAAAREVRRRLIDPLKEEAIAAKLLPEDVHVETAPSYFTRLYDTAKIAARRPDFEARISTWLGEMRDSAGRSADQRIGVEADSKAAKVIEQEREFAGLTDGDIKSIASEITDKILGASPGRIQYGPIPLARGPLKERTLNIPDAMIEDYLNSDVEHVARVYARTMATDVELTKAFGRADMEEQIAKINDSFAKLREGVTDEKQLRKLEDRRKSDIADIQGMRDRIRGTYALPDNPNSIVMRASRTLRQLNYLRLLGGMTVSSASDAARPVMIHGLQRVMANGLAPLISRSKLWKPAAKEVKLAGTALDMILDSRAMQLADIWDDYGRFSPMERGIQAMADRYGVVTAMAPWNAFWKQFAGVIGQTRNLQAINDIAKGAAGKPEIERLAFLGIGREQASRIADEFAKHGKKDSGIWWANTEAWTDKEAADAFRHAIAKEVDLTIVTPGQDKPLWMSTELGKVIGQFRTFTMSSMTQVTQLGLQRRDAAFLQGVVLSVGLGMLSVYLRRVADGKGMPEDPTQWVADGVDRSGVLSWVSDANAMAEKVTRNNVGLAMLTGKPTASRYQSRNAVGALLGPSFGTASDAIELTGSLASGEWTSSDTRKMRQLLPYQNLFYLRQLFNAGEEGLNASLGIPDKPKTVTVR